MYLTLNSSLDCLLTWGYKEYKELFWDTKESQVIPFFSRIMSCNKFLLILSNLQLITAGGFPRGHPSFDPWFKVSFVLDSLNRAFQKYVVPYQNVCLDESLIDMKNRCVYIQYLPNKKHKRCGIKQFETCDSQTNYVIHIELYSSQDFLVDVPGPFVQKCVLQVITVGCSVMAITYLLTNSIQKYHTCSRITTKEDLPHWDN